MKITHQGLQEKTGFRPHSAQNKILQAFGKREIVISAGRRFGKSILCAYAALGKLLGDDQRIWIVSPTYGLSQKVFDYITRWIMKSYPSLGAGISSRPTPEIITPWSSFVKSKSTENPQSLLGEELDLVIIDEASRIRKDVFQNYIFPCLSSRQGKLIIISTPFGKNWFYDEWLKSKQWKEGAAFHFTSKDNPYLPKEEWKLAKEKLPLRVFLQEYQALFTEEAAAVFRNVRECIKGGFEDVQQGHYYVLGVDLGKFHDFTVLSVVDTLTNHLVYFERFNKIDWRFQRSRVKNIAERYNRARIIVDSTGKGDPFVDELEADGFLVEPYFIKSNKEKRNLIEKLSIFLDQRKITYPPVEILMDELESFTYKMSEAGNIKYEAPEGLYDDSVISLALAVWFLSQDSVEMTPIQKELFKEKRSVRFSSQYM